MKETEIFAKNLKNLMCKKQITQTELGMAIGCSQNNISILLTGFRFPSVEYLLRMSDFFGVTMDELVRKEILNLQEEN